MKKPQWKVTALAAVVTAVVLGVAASDAQALALGRVTVQSALGEPLRADIDLPDINAEELASLRATVGSPEAFRVAGLEYTTAMAGVQITLQKRTDGRHFLRLSSDRPVNEPFVDLVLDAKWSSGRIVRDYTLLFDPPNLRGSATPLAAQVSPVAPPTPMSATPAPRLTPAPAPSAAPGPRAETAPRPASAPRRAPAPQAASAPKAAAGEGKQVKVQPGDTAGAIAAAHKPPTISLDQMLVALLRANPEAFPSGNVNRLKAGAVLEVPTREQIAAVGPGEANQIVIAQSRDFNEFRRKLAEGIPASQLDAAARQASGKVQAQVEEKKPAAVAPDKLTLSKGSVQDKAGEARIAKDRAAQDASARVAELNKNMAELSKLGTATGGPASAASAAAKPGVAVPVAGSASLAKAAATPASAPTAAPTPALATAATAAASAASAPAATASAASASASAPGATASAPAASAATAAASAPAAAASDALAPTPMAVASAAVAPVAAASAVAVPKPPVAVPARPEPSLLDDLLDNPLIPAAAGGLIALLLGVGFYRSRQRRKSAQVDSSFLESRLQPDSFFGASGGQRIDTNEASPTGSSMVYSPSQLDAAGDVDPVAEADVYLAYGRDLQAEEILKEAMRMNPQRVTIHAKLLEIYSKRRDAKAFELVATEAYSLTRGHGSEWEHICELGRELDAGNPLYQPGGQPTEGSMAVGAPSGAIAQAAARPVRPAEVAPPPSSHHADLDLDLDFSLGEDEPIVPKAPAPSARTPAPQPLQAHVEPLPSLDLPSFDTNPAPLDTQPSPLAGSALTLPDNGLSFSPAPAKAPAPRPAPPAIAAPAAPDTGMIEFDLGALSLDLGGAAAAAPAASAPMHEEAVDSHSTAGLDLDSGNDDPLATKLALAEEFNAIGDADGARSLAEEVLAEASGDLKTRAKRFLAEIN